MAIDESLFVHNDMGKLQWVVGDIDTTTKEIRLDVIYERNMSNLKIFIQNHIEPDSNIIHDGWRRYRFLTNDNESIWTHEEYNHDGGNFGLGIKVENMDILHFSVIMKKNLKNFKIGI